MEPAQDQYVISNNSPLTKPALVIPPPVVSPVTPVSIPPKKSKIGVIIGGVFFAILLLLVSAALVSVYARVDLPFVSPQTRQQLVLFTSKIPLIPKTPEQILLAAADSNSKLISYTPEFSVSASLGGTAVNAGSLDFKLVGPVDFTNNQLTFDLAADIGVNVAGTLYQGKGQVRQVGKTVYAKIDTVSDSVISLIGSFGRYFGGIATSTPSSQVEIKANLEKAFVNWLVYDTSGIESEARKKLDANVQNKSLIDSSRKNTQDFLLNKQVLPEVKLEKNETIEGTNTYHLHVTPSKETLKKLMLELTPADRRLDKNLPQQIDSVVAGVDTIVLDAWFGVKDTILRRMSIQTQINLETMAQAYSRSLDSKYGSYDPSSYLKSLGGQKLSLSTVLTLRDIGKPVQVSAPTQTQTPVQYLQMIQDATKTQDQKDAEAKAKQYQDDFRLLSTALLKYYVAKTIYPEKLDLLKGSYLPATDTVWTRVNTYAYKTRASGKKYVVYIEYASTTSNYGGYTPFYGVSSESTYPHQLTQRDFD